MAKFRDDRVGMSDKGFKRPPLASPLHIAFSSPPLPLPPPFSPLPLSFPLQMKNIHLTALNYQREANKKTGKETLTFP